MRTTTRRRVNPYAGLAARLKMYQDELGILSIVEIAEKLAVLRQERRAFMTNSAYRLDRGYHRVYAAIIKLQNYGEALADSIRSDDDDWCLRVRLGDGEWRPSDEYLASALVSIQEIEGIDMRAVQVSPRQFWFFYENKDIERMLLYRLKMLKLNWQRFPPDIYDRDDIVT